MKSSTLFLLRTFLATLFALLLLPQSNGQNRAEDEQAIRDVITGVSDALVQKDWETYQAYFVQDSTLRSIHPEDMDWAIGWEAFEMRLKPVFESDIELDYALNRAEIFVGPGGDCAWAATEFSIFTQGTEMHTWHIWVLIKSNNSWRINLGFSSSIPMSESR